MSGLDDFADKVSNFLKSAIDRTYQTANWKSDLDKDSAELGKH